MRLVIATPLYPPEPGGPATYASMLEELLPVESVEVALVKYRDVRHLPPGFRHLAYMQKVMKAAKGADLVLALDPVSTGLPALLAAFVMRKPCVVKIVGDYAWEQGKQRYGVEQDLDAFVRTKWVPLEVMFLRFVQTFVAKRAKAVIVPSQYLKSIVMSWGIPEWKMNVIYNAMKTEAPGRLPREVEGEPRPRVTTVGRLVPWKNVDAVIDAMRSVGQGSLIVVGDGPERIALQRHAQEMLPGTLFTGALPHDETLAVIADADVFVLNSSYEGLSHLLIEAACLGTPIVATNVGGNPEVVKSDAEGLLVPPGDTKLLANAIAVSLAKGRKTKPEQAIVRFSPRAMAKATAGLLKELSRV